MLLFFLVIMNDPFLIISVVFWRIFWMDGMHEANEKRVLMAQHQCACSCQNRGVFIPKQGVFIALEMCKMSLCPNSHDHAKFSHDCVKLIRVVQKFLTLWTILHNYANISHDYANISHDYAKSSLSTAAKWTLWSTSHTYTKISHVCAKIFSKRKKTKLPPI